VNGQGPIRHVSDGQQVREAALQALLDAIVEASSQAGVSTGVLFELRPREGRLEPGGRSLARAEARIARRWLREGALVETLEVVMHVLSGEGALEWRSLSG